MVRTLEQYPNEEEHPCKCDEKYAQCVDDKFEWIKRSYYEYTRYYWCMKCDCHWYIEEYMETRHASVVITQEPQENDE
tara:strand:- start:17 stop:250 length:234 start_codon:yes stop_codon:yes gene_type:complete